jgi:glycosyltransferase involved in cell wall biosynthesis
VSVLLPVRDGMPWLPAALDSLARQTLRDLEVIVLEDGSTDGTRACLGAWRDPRVRVVPTGGVGIAAALNAGLAEARGLYVARQDADDESRPQRLARQAAHLDAHPDVAVVATVADYVDLDGRPIENTWVRTVRRQQDTALTPEAIARLMPVTCCVTHGSVMARAAVLREAGGYRPDRVPAEDYDLWLRLLRRHRIAKLGEPLYQYRVRPGGASARQTDMAILSKLEHLVRVRPDVAGGALALLGTARGDAFYRAVAPRLGFRVVSLREPWDVLAVTDLTRLDEYVRLADASHFETIGNCIVRRPGRALRRTA